MNDFILKFVTIETSLLSFMCHKSDPRMLNFAERLIELGLNSESDEDGKYYFCVMVIINHQGIMPMFSQWFEQHYRGR